MSIPPAWPYVLYFSRTPLVIEPSSGQLSSDAGLPGVRQFEQRIGLTRALELTEKTVGFRPNQDDASR